MTDTETVIGFDLAADGAATIVVMHRDADGWHLDVPAQPDYAELAAATAAALDRFHIVPPIAAPPMAEQVIAWLDRYAGEKFDFHLSDEQRQILRHFYEQSPGRASLTGRHITAALTVPIRP